jgi:hypothetical protein
MRGLDFIALIPGSSLPIEFSDAVVAETMGFGSTWRESRKSMFPFSLWFKEGIQVGNMIWVFDAVAGMYDLLNSQGFRTPYNCRTLFQEIRISCLMSL